MRTTCGDRLRWWLQSICQSYSSIPNVLIRYDMIFTTSSVILFIHGYYQDVITKSCCDCVVVIRQCMQRVVHPTHVMRFTSVSSCIDLKLEIIWYDIHYLIEVVYFNNSFLYDVLSKSCCGCAGVVRLSVFVASNLSQLLQFVPRPISSYLMSDGMVCCVSLL